MSTTQDNPPEELSRAPSLGVWNAYFILKLVLYWRGLIGFHPLENLAFACVLLVPLGSPRLRQVRAVVAVLVGLALFYYDSWLPPFTRVLSQAHLIASFSPDYMMELAARFINPKVVAILALAWAAYYLLARWLRVGVLTMVALVVLVLQGTSVQPSAEPAGASAAVQDNNELDRALLAFYAQESQHRVNFPKINENGVPFDLIFLHVCSLSWDDLRFFKLENHPFWQRFDLVFTHFNSAAAYSGPAAIRLLRAPCGQQSHQSLYSPVGESCRLLGALRQGGFDPQLVFNHDGHFDDFLGFVQGSTSASLKPMSLVGLPVPQRAYDDSPIHDDLAALSRWLDIRQKAEVGSVALYYNTISLHDGNRLVAGATKGSSLETYKIRLLRLFDDMENFLQKLESSGRRAVVVLIPEHGAAVRGGNQAQIAGLRETPSSMVTLVPVGIKIIGPDVRRQGNSVLIDEPSSYLAISQIVARMIERPPFGAAEFSIKDYISDLSRTPFVSENEDVVIVQQKGRYYVRHRNEKWSDYGSGEGT